MSSGTAKKKSRRRERGASMDGGQKDFDSKAIVSVMKRAVCAVR